MTVLMPVWLFGYLAQCQLTVLIVILFAYIVRIPDTQTDIVD